MSVIRRISWQPGALLALIAALVALQWRPLREESATVDEPVVLTCGYANWRGFGARLNPEHPPLGQSVMALPVLLADVRWTEDMEALASLRVGSEVANPWFRLPQPVAELFPGGRDNWYFWPVREMGALAEIFVFGGANDADGLIRRGRWVAVMLTVLTALVIAAWLYRQAGATAAVLGVALWVFNPLVLAYGHLILNDMGVALMMTLAVWAYGAFLTTPTMRLAALVGLAMGGALMMKFSALLLGPMLAAVMVAWWWTTPGRDWRGVARGLPVAAMVAYGVILLAYAPSWAPAPPLSAEEAARWNVPGWFRALRPVLVPADFFKGVALQMAHARTGHAAFFHGEWRMTGWWYYFPVALALKWPVALSAVTLLGLGLWLGRGRGMTLAEATPWVAGLVYLGCSMAGTINIGVRYLLPLLPLVAVGVAMQVMAAGRMTRVATWVLVAWAAVVTARAHPHFLEYFNEWAGGPVEGYRWLVDSNFDWGQDGKRLKSYLAARGDPPVSIAYFGSEMSLDYYGVRHTKVTAKEAAAGRGTLVISASELMRPRWRWLREQHQPVDRIGYTLFVYQLGE